MRDNNAAEDLFLKKLGQKIQETRKKKKISVEQFVQKIGIERTQLWRIENGKVNNTTVIILHRISAALEMPLTKLVNVD